MIEDISHNCGVAAVYLKKPLSEYPLGGAAHYLQIMLQHMQNRGRLSAGIAGCRPSCGGLYRHVGPGLVHQLFCLSQHDQHVSLMESLSTLFGIGHVRYATSGNALEDRMVIEEAQPFLRIHGNLWKEFAFAYNGNLTNSSSLMQELITDHHYTVKTNVDTELMMHLFAIDLKILIDHCSEKPSLADLIKKSASRFDGAFSVAFMNGGGDLIGFRDPHGFRPFVWGQNESLIAFASESLALNKIGIHHIEDVPPGGYILISHGETQIGSYAPALPSHCMFEYVYFSRAPSVIGGLTVNTVRKRLGEELARIEPLIPFLNDEFIVVPVPDTSIPIALSLAKKLGIDFVPAIYKTEEFGRGFINKSRERKRVIDGKYTIIAKEVSQRRLIVVEDSVVRGETFNSLGDALRKNGAKEIHLRSACPPIRNPCFYGIDFPTTNELIACDTSTTEDAEQKVAASLRLDSMKYISLEGLVRAIGLPQGHLCLACLDGKYPTEGGRERFVQLTRSL